MKVQSSIYPIQIYLTAYFNCLTYFCVANMSIQSFWNAFQDFSNKKLKVKPKKAQNPPYHLHPLFQLDLRDSFLILFFFGWRSEAQDNADSKVEGDGRLRTWLWRTPEGVPATEQNITSCQRHEDSAPKSDYWWCFHWVKHASDT